MENKTHWKKLTNPNYLGAWDFEPKEEKVLEIKSITQEDVMNLDGKNESCVLAHFDGFKPMILNKTNMKAIQKVTGSPMIEDWPGNRVTLFTAQVRAFGDVVDAVRIRPTKPKAAPKKPEITAESFLKAIAAVKSGKYQAEQVRAKYRLNADQEKALAKAAKDVAIRNENGGQPSTNQTPSK